MAKTMKDLMIDIETMGIGDKPAMIQLGACYFDRKTGKTGHEFCENISLNDCLEQGFTKDPKTEEWWSKQNQDILKDILENNKPVEEVMTAFSNFMTHAEFIWSHATFDFPIVQTYLKHCSVWYMTYKTARDIRTLVDLSGIDLDSYDWDKKTHNALDDCKFQITYCVDAMNLLKIKKKESQ